MPLPTHKLSKERGHQGIIVAKKCKRTVNVGTTFSREKNRERTCGVNRHPPFSGKENGTSPKSNSYTKKRLTSKDRNRGIINVQGNYFLAKSVHQSLPVGGDGRLCSLGQIPGMDCPEFLASALQRSWARQRNRDKPEAREHKVSYLVFPTPLCSRKRLYHEERVRCAFC